MPARPRWWRRAERLRLVVPLAIWLVSIAASYLTGGFKPNLIGVLSWGNALAMILLLWWSIDASNRMFAKIQKARALLIDERLAMREWSQAQAMKMRRYIYGEDRDFR